MLNALKIAKEEKRHQDRPLAELPKELRRQLREGEVAPENTRQWFVVEPAQLYPAAVADLIEVVEAGRQPSHPALIAPYHQARALGAGGLKTALVPRHKCPPDDLALRAEALEVARLWFTEKLHQAIDNAPMGLHIVKDEAYRL